MVGWRWRERRQPALLLWTLGLVCYATSTGAQAVGEVVGWPPLLYRLWYLAGAFYTAALLGMGSLYLVAPRPVAHGVMVCLGIGLLAVAPLVLLAPLDPAGLPSPGEAPTGQAIHEAIRKATVQFNIFGTLALILGALWGAVHYWRQGRSPRAYANLLIALGALLPSFSTGLTRFGITAPLALGQLLGLVLILAGAELAQRSGRSRTA